MSPAPTRPAINVAGSGADETDCGVSGGGSGARPPSDGGVSWVESGGPDPTTGGGIVGPPGSVAGGWTPPSVGSVVGGPGGTDGGPPDNGGGNGGGNGGSGSPKMNANDGAALSAHATTAANAHRSIRF